MTTGRIPLYRGEQHVGHVLWTGTIASGTWRYVPRRGIPTAADDRAAVRLAVEERQDLARRWFAWRGDREFRGWHGFPGILGALGAALPAVGLRVDRSTAVWPSSRGAPPRGVLMGAWETDRAQDDRAAEAARATTSAAFRSRWGADNNLTTPEKQEYP